MAAETTATNNAFQTHTTLPTDPASRYNNGLSNLGEILMAVFTPLSDVQVAAFLEKFDVGSFVSLQGVRRWHRKLDVFCDHRSS